MGSVDAKTVDGDIVRASLAWLLKRGGVAAIVSCVLGLVGGVAGQRALTPAATHETRADALAAHESRLAVLESSMTTVKASLDKMEAGQDRIISLLLAQRRNP